MNEFYKSRPEDHVALQMENELLIHEVRHLRALLGDSDSDWEIEVHRATVEELARYRRGYHEMCWLVRRLNNSPAGFVLRCWKGFRVLVARYEGDGG